MKEPAGQLAPALLAGLEAFDRDDYALAATRWGEAAVAGEAEGELLAALAALAVPGPAAVRDFAAGEAELLRARSAGDPSRNLWWTSPASGERPRPAFALAAPAPARSRRALALIRLGRWGVARQHLRHPPLDPGGTVQPERLLALLERADDHWWMPGLLSALRGALSARRAATRCSSWVRSSASSWHDLNVLGTCSGRRRPTCRPQPGREAVKARWQPARPRRADAPPARLHRARGLRFLPVPFRSSTPPPRSRHPPALHRQLGGGLTGGRGWTTWPRAPPPPIAPARPRARDRARASSRW